MSWLVRQLKLHALVGAKAATDDRVANIMTLFGNLFDGLECSVLPEYEEDNVIFHKGETFYMEPDFENDWLFCRYDGVWSFLENNLCLCYDDSQMIIKYMVGRYYTQLASKPVVMCNVNISNVEKYLKRQVGKPYSVGPEVYRETEAHLKKMSA